MTQRGRQPLYTIGDESLENWERLGSGGFGDVYKAKYKDLDTEVAIKLLRRDDGSSRSALQREADYMEAADHQFVPGVYGMYRGPGLGSTERHGIVMELMERGDLQSLLNTLSKPPPWPLAFHLAHQVAQAMNFLHSKKELVHMDLKPANVLLDAKLHAKIADFGLSTVSHSVLNTGGKDKGGTLEYTPPEAFKDGYHRVRSYDVYSYGILLWTILTGEKPYPGKDRALVEFRIQEGDRPDLKNIDVKKADGLEELVELMKRCWDGEPTERPKFKECIEVTRRVSSRHEEGIDAAVHEVLIQLVPGYKNDSAKENKNRQDNEIYLDLNIDLSSQVDAVDGLTSLKEKVHFVMQHRAPLIQMVRNVRPIIDDLLSRNIIHAESHAVVLSQRTSMEQMRHLLSVMLTRRQRAALYDALKVHEAFLIEEIGIPPREQLQSEMAKKFRYLFEWVGGRGRKTLLDEANITVGGIGEVSNKRTFEDIFERLPGQDEPIRTVMIKGVAGIGKTVLTEKYIRDWAEEKANQNIHFMVPFTFRELNLGKEKNFSLEELLKHHGYHHCFGEIKEAEIHIFKGSNVVLIFEGLDESNFPLDFQNNEIWTDVTKPTSVDVLLTNLIKGNLLPSARILITTRPAAANQIPSAYVDRVTELKGFTDPQKKEFFNKRFSNENQARTVISHIMMSESLHMCEIPVFCWITANVLEDVLRTQKGGALPKYLTEMYIRFILVLSKQKKAKYHHKAQTDSDWNLVNTQAILSLGKLAFEQLDKGNEIHEADLKACGIDIRDASVYSGVFTQIYKEECSLHKVFCFIHLSVQEFLAALFVFQHFINTGINLLAEPQTPSTSSTLLTGKSNLHNLYQSAVDKTLQSPNRHLDMVLRFLLGFSLETNQFLLEELLNQTQRWSQTNQETVDYIKTKISESPYHIKMYLIYCLKEMNV